MSILGNICLALALFLYALPLQLMLHDPIAGRKHDGGVVWGTVFVLVPFWLLLALSLCTATSRGGLDWLFRGRPPQYLVVLLGCAALLIVTGFSMIAKYEPASQMPVAARPFTGWAVVVFPLVAMGYCLLTLNQSLGASVPSLAYRLPLVAITALSMLATLGMLGEWFVRSYQDQIARAERAIEEDNERERSNLERVQSLNPTSNFPELLGFTNRFHNEAIRQVAIEKVRSHPQFVAELAEVLQNGWAEKGLVYLDACDVPEADRIMLAEPVRAAVVVLTQDAEDSVERTHTFYAEQFDWNTRLILSVADKFQSSGVDYVPAIRDFRAALDAPRGRDFNFYARRPLDAWLAKHP